MVKVSLLQGEIIRPNFFITNREKKLQPKQDFFVSLARQQMTISYYGINLCHIILDVLPDV